MEIINVDGLYTGEYMGLHEALEKYSEVLHIEEEREILVKVIRVGDREAILLAHRCEVEIDVGALKEARETS